VVRANGIPAVVQQVDDVRVLGQRDRRRPPPGRPPCTGPNSPTSRTHVRTRGACRSGAGTASRPLDRRGAHLAGIGAARRGTPPRRGLGDAARLFAAARTPRFCSYGATLRGLLHGDAHQPFPSPGGVQPLPMASRSAGISRCRFHMPRRGPPALDRRRAGRAWSATAGRTARSPRPSGGRGCRRPAPRRGSGPARRSGRPAPDRAGLRVHPQHGVRVQLHDPWAGDGPGQGPLAAEHRRPEREDEELQVPLGDVGVRDGRGAALGVDQVAGDVEEPATSVMP
jgi:hypothetical protein